MTQAEHNKLAGEASRLLKSEQDEQALTILEKLTETLPDNTSIQATRAFCLGKLNRFDEAYELIAYLSTLTDSPRIQQTIDFLDARKALVYGRPRPKLREKVSNTHFAGLNVQGQDKDALGKKLMLIQQKVDAEIAELRKREKEANQDLRLLKKRLVDKERALQNAYAKNVDLEGLLSEVGQDVSDLQFSMFYPQKHKLHIVPKESPPPVDQQELKIEKQEVERLTEVMRERDETLSAAFRKNSDLQKQLSTLQEAIELNTQEDSELNESDEVEHNALSEQLRALQDELEEAQTRIASHENDRTVWEREQQNLTQNVLELLGRHKEDEELLHEKNVRVVELEHGITQAKTDLEASSEQHIPQTHTMDHHEETQTGLAEISEELDVLRSEKETLTESLEAIEDKWKFANKKVSALEERTTNQRIHYQKQREYLLEVTAEKNLLETALARVHEKVSHAETRWISTLSRLAITEKNLHDLTTRLEIETRDQSDIAESLQIAESALATSRAALNVQLEEIESLNQEVSGHQESLKQEHDRAEALALETADAQEALAGLEAREAELLAQLEAETTGTEAYRAELKALNSALNVYQEQGKAQEFTHQEILDERVRVQKELVLLQEQLEYAHTDMAGQATRHTELEQTVENLRADRDENQAALMSTQEALVSTEAALSTSQDTLATTEAALTAEQDLLATTEGLLSTTREELSSTHDALVSTEGALSTSRETLSTTQKTLTTAEVALSTKQEELSTSQETLSSTQKALTDLEQKWSAKLEEHSRLIQSHSELSEADKKLIDTRQQLSVLENELKESLSAFEALQKEYQALEAQHHVAEDELGAVREALTATNTELSTLQEQFAQLENSHADLELMQKGTAKELSSTVKQLSELESEQATLNTAHEQLLERYAGLEQNKATTAEELADARSEIKRLEMVWNEMHEAHETLLQAKDKLEQRTTHYASELKIQIEVLGELELSLTKLQQAHDNLFELKVQLQVSKNTVQEELKDARVQLQGLESELRDLNQSHEALVETNVQTQMSERTTREELVATRIHLRNAKTDLDALHVVHETLLDEHAALEAQREKAQQSLDSTHAQLKETEHSLESTTHDLGESRQEFDDLSREQEHLQAAKEELENTLASTELALRELGQQFEVTTIERNDLESQRDVLDATLKTTAEELNNLLDEKFSVETSLLNETKHRESLEVALAKLITQKENLESELEIHAQSIVVMTQQLDGISQHLFDEKEALKHSREEYQQLRANHIQTNAALGSTREELKDTQEAKAATETELKSTEAELHTTKGEVTRRKNMLSEQAVVESELRADIDHLSEGVKTRTEEIFELTETTTTLRERVVNLTTDLTVMTQQEAEFQATVSQLELRLKELNESFDQSQHNLTDANKNIDTYTLRIEKIEKNLQKNRRALANLQSRYDALSGVSDKREVQRVETIAERDLYREELKVLEEEWDTLRNVELPEALEQKVRALRDMQRLQAEVDMLRKQLF